MALAALGLEPVGVDRGVAEQMLGMGHGPWMARGVSGRGRVPLSSMELHRRWRRVLIVARVRYRKPEQLRHTFASTMLSRNAPLLYVQGQGGWRSASVLLRVYARWMPDTSVGGAPGSTIRNPAATSAPRRGRARAPQRALATGSHRTPAPPPRAAR